MWKRGEYLQTCVLPPDNLPDVWAVENVATLPAFRGRCIAGQLLEHALTEARRNGTRQAQITFFIGNDAAERAYAKAAFKFNDEKRDSRFEAATGAPGLRRYVREL